MKIQSVVLIVCILSWMNVSAQKKYSSKGSQYNSKGKKERYRPNTGSLKRNRTDVFPLDRNYRLSGWFGSIGGTYMIPLSGGENSVSQTVMDSSGLQTLTLNPRYESKGKGSLGFYADIGYWKSFNNPGFFHFWEIGASYRQYKGSENASGSVTSRADSSSFSSTTTQFDEWSNSFNDQAVSLVAKITRHRHFSQYWFFQHSFGLNVDYFFSMTESASWPSDYDLVYEPEFHPQIQAQINYRLGVGWKAAPNLLIIPSIEVPLITAYPFENGKSSLAYFTTRQYPIIFTIRAMLLRPLNEDCIVPNYDGPTNFQ